MTKRQLIASLETYSNDQEIMIFDIEEGEFHRIEDIVYDAIDVQEQDKPIEIHINTGS